MTVNTVSPAIISRAEFNLNAGQTKTPQLVRMDFGNLVTNGGFDTDTDWTKGTGWTIAAGVASKVTGAGSNIQQTLTSMIVGAKYYISIDLTSFVSGGSSVQFILGANTSVATSTPGATYSAAVFSSSTNNGVGLFFGSLASGDADNFTVYEADPSDDAPWLRLPYGYSVGRTGMIVRDGVVLHPSDYTEVKDSGQTWIKPIVAPGVSTEFSIWGSPSYAV